MGDTFLAHLMPIIKAYKQSGAVDSPLDGDEVDRLIGHIRNAINLQEGNITTDEYIILETAR